MLGASPGRVWREVDLPIVARAPRSWRPGSRSRSRSASSARPLFIVRPDDADAAGLDLPAARPARRAELRRGDGGERDPDGARPRSRSSRSSASASAIGRRRSDARASSSSRCATATSSRSTASTSTVADGEIVCVLGPERERQEHAAARGRRARARRDRARARGTATTSPASPPHRRGFGLMFQDHALFPHRDVLGNVAFGLRMQRRPARRGRRARRATTLDARRPRRASSTGGSRELSGGEQQRVALARALAPAPRLLMLDEPLGALDRALRERLVAELRALFVRLGLTILFVTHDHDEAFALADRVVVMHDGPHRAGRRRPAEVWRPPGDRVRRRLPRLERRPRRSAPGRVAVRPEAPARSTARRRRRRGRRRRPDVPPRPLPRRGRARPTARRLEVAVATSTAARRPRSVPSSASPTVPPRWPLRSPAAPSLRRRRRATRPAPNVRVASICTESPQLRQDTRRPAPYP